VDVRWHTLDRSGARLCAADYGGAGPPVLLLHGLAGHAREWDSTAAWLARSHRVVAVEARAHGRSERSPGDVTPEAFAADAAHWIEELRLAPAVVAGQSLGGLTALLLAARRPDLVRGLVVAEATPARDPGGVDIVERWLATWPLPFPSPERARDFFGGDTLRARTWCASLELHGDGLWPAFEPAVLLAALTAANARDHWDDWAGVRCPALVVRAAGGAPLDECERMIELLPGARLAEIADAGHDVHLDQPERWTELLSTFLATVDR
jgi:pimeloyl-ACP methyl ester carboxylesterase